MSFRHSASLQCYILLSGRGTWTLDFIDLLMSASLLARACELELHKPAFGFPIMEGSYRKLFITYSPIFIKIDMNLYQNRPRMAQEYSRICLNVILVLKQPSKVKFWTSKLGFECFDVPKMSVCVHNNNWVSQISNSGSQEKVPMDLTDHCDFR